MQRDRAIDPPRFRPYGRRSIARIPGIENLSHEQRVSLEAVSAALPFRVNDYVVKHLIDWGDIPQDPMYQLTFPQAGMLEPQDFARLRDLVGRGEPSDLVQAVARRIQERMNPHPAGQKKLNVPEVDGEPLPGCQHKYRETVLFFPSQGQTCHSYCTFCFRWAQFVGDKELRIASSEAETMLGYLRVHRDVSDLLITGGDPMVMKTRNLAQYLEPLLAREYDHIQTVRIGTKALTFWPYRFVTDNDADDLLRLLERMVDAGKNVAVMAHYNHWRELDTPIARAAIRRLRETGVTIRSQGPLLAHINDRAEDWARLWREQVRVGIHPYYLFVERDTGARQYFEVPLARAWEIYRDAMQSVSGLSRTARGPSMSAGPGKVEVQGVTEIQGEKVFVLRFLQGRNPDWVQRPFFARFDPEATWLDQLRPAFGEERFFFEGEYASMLPAA